MEGDNAEAEECGYRFAKPPPPPPVLTLPSKRWYQQGVGRHPADVRNHIDYSQQRENNVPHFYPNHYPERAHNQQYTEFSQHRPPNESNSYSHEKRFSEPPPRPYSESFPRPEVKTHYVPPYTSHQDVRSFSDPYRTGPKTRHSHFDHYPDRLHDSFPPRLESKSHYSDQYPNFSRSDSFRPSDKHPDPRYEFASRPENFNYSHDRYPERPPVDSMYSDFPQRTHSFPPPPFAGQTFAERQHPSFAERPSTTHPLDVRHPSFSDHPAERHFFSDRPLLERRPPERPSFPDHTAFPHSLIQPPDRPSPPTNPTDRFLQDVQPGHSVSRASVGSQSYFAESANSSPTVSEPLDSFPRGCDRPSSTSTDTPAQRISLLEIPANLAVRNVHLDRGVRNLPAISLRSDTSIRRDAPSGLGPRLDTLARPEALLSRTDAGLISRPDMISRPEPFRLETAPTLRSEVIPTPRYDGMPTPRFEAPTPHFDVTPTPRFDVTPIPRFDMPALRPDMAAPQSDANSAPRSDATPISHSDVISASRSDVMSTSRADAIAIRSEGTPAPQSEIMLVPRLETAIPRPDATLARTEIVSPRPDVPTPRSDAMGAPRVEAPTLRPDITPTRSDSTPRPDSSLWPDGSSRQDTTLTPRPETRTLMASLRKVPSGSPDSLKPRKYPRTEAGVPLLSSPSALIDVRCLGPMGERTIVFADRIGPRMPRAHWTPESREQTFANETEEEKPEVSLREELELRYHKQVLAFSELQQQALLLEIKETAIDRELSRIRSKTVLLSQSL